jgi:hypothetical protein
MNKVLNATNVDDTFPSLAIALVLTLLLWGPVAMLAGSVIGLAAFVLIYRKRLRTRGWLTAAVAVAVSAALAAAIAIAVR